VGKRGSVRESWQSKKTEERAFSQVAHRPVDASLFRPSTVDRLKRRSEWSSGGGFQILFCPQA